MARGTRTSSASLFNDILLLVNRQHERNASKVQLNVQPAYFNENYNTNKV